MPRRPQVKTVIERITPKMATEMLKRNNCNRTRSQTLVERYGRDMQAGNWKLTGEPIIFDMDDQLADGQHRLFACAESGYSFVSVVTRGVDPITRLAMGSGKSRSAADHLKIGGFQSAADIAAALNVVWQWNQVPSLYIRRKKSPTRHEMDAALTEIPDIADVIAETKSMYRNGDRNVGPVSLIAGVYLILRKIDEATALAWRHGLLVGSDLPASDPRFVLRKLFGRDKNDPHAASDAAKRFFLVRCWNAMRSGETLHKYQYNNQLDIEAL